MAINGNSFCERLMNGRMHAERWWNDTDWKKTEIFGERGLAIPLCPFQILSALVQLRIQTSEMKYRLPVSLGTVRSLEVCVKCSLASLLLTLDLTPRMASY